MSEEDQLFDTSQFVVENKLGPTEKLITVIPDVSNINKEFYYILPEKLQAKVQVGSIVSIRFKGRKILGWVSNLEPKITQNSFKLEKIESLFSLGPSSEIMQLSEWASKRWVSQQRKFLRTASPGKPIRHFSNLMKSEPKVFSDTSNPEIALNIVSPIKNYAEYIQELYFSLSANSKLNGVIVVIAPMNSQVRYLIPRLKRYGIRAIQHDGNWAAGLEDGIVLVGTSKTIWASVSNLKAICVLDESSNLLYSQSSPTWNVKEVAVQRSKITGAICHFVSATPSVLAKCLANQSTVSSKVQLRQGWARIQTVDMREPENSGKGLFTKHLVDELRKVQSALIIFDRKGRSSLLVCADCSELVRTEDKSRPMIEVDGMLKNLYTGEVRPMLCADCGSLSLKRIRPGVKLAAEQLQNIIGQKVVDLDKDDPQELEAKFVISTQAGLNRNFSPDLIVFLDFDQHLYSSYFNSAEVSFSLLARASRMLSGRESEGIIIQTRTPDHICIRSAIEANPDLMLEEQYRLKKMIGLPPFKSVAEVSGKASEEYIQKVRNLDSDIEILGPKDGAYLLKAECQHLQDTLFKVGRIPGKRMRLAVDPFDI